MYYKIILAYDGTNYHGWAKQKNTTGTIQQVVEDIFIANFGTPAITLAAGRTDAGVHAWGQCIRLEHPKVKMVGESLKKMMNTFLPKDIRVLSAEIVDQNFQPRYVEHQKVYTYKINTGPYNIFERNTVYQYNKALDLERINAVKKLFVGTKDYLAFSTSELTNTIRTIREITVKSENQMVLITVIGDGFLKNMVRMIVGTLIAYANQEIDIDFIEMMFRNPQKGAAHWKAPACGLYLMTVKY